MKLRVVAFCALFLPSLAWAQPAEPPRVLPGLGAPVSDAEIDERLKQYCRPIAAWSRPAYQLCLEAGVAVNLAAREYHLENCQRGEGRSICQQARALYQQNFRLWDGSVDNVGRAKARLGGKANKKLEQSGALSGCKRRYQQALVQARDNMQAEQNWMSANAEVLALLSAEGVTLRIDTLSDKLSAGGFKPPVSSKACVQSMKAEHAKFSQQQSEHRKQLAAALAEWKSIHQSKMVLATCQALADDTPLLTHRQNLLNHYPLDYSLWYVPVTTDAPDALERYRSAVKAYRAAVVPNFCSSEITQQFSSRLDSHEARIILAEKSLWAEKYLALASLQPPLKSKQPIWLWLLLGAGLFTAASVAAFVKLRKAPKEADPGR
ncbi:hypothetical protein ACFSJ3_00730 [Corallincola platygyrae]|uniref:Uncharacterized protein n=1 Tax=Corallincola platygyrae TaxID=1193278 RepID=A0ABW4XHH3_9GAMM